MVNQTPKLYSPELRKLRILLIGLLVVNFSTYVVILILSSLTDMLNTALYSTPIITGYYILEGSFFFGCQAYNWPCTLTFRIILLLHDFAYFITYALFAAFYPPTYLDHEKPWDEYCKSILDYDVNSQCSDYGSAEEYCKVWGSPPWGDKWCMDYCIAQPSDHLCYSTFIFNVALTCLFLLAFGLGIGIIVAFSNFPHPGCCHRTNSVQNVAVSGLTYPMQRMSYGQNDLLPSYDKVLES